MYTVKLCCQFPLCGLQLSIAVAHQLCLQHTSHHTISAIPIESLPGVGLIRQQPQS
jgi:hypothetical protein